MSTKTTVDPFAEFDLVCEFPLAVDTFAELRRYVRTIHGFLPGVSAQKAVRMGARVKRENDPVRIGEIEYELEKINIDSRVSLPRLIWGGVLVTIFGAYENSVTNILKHWQMTTRHPNEFPRAGRKDMLKAASQYSKSNLGVALFESEQLRQAITELKYFRRSFAHGSGLLSDLPADQAAAVRQKQHIGVSMSIEEGKWVANSQSAAYYLLYAEKASTQFAYAVLDKCIAHHRALPKEA